MADYITAIRTATGDKLIDYQSLANKEHASQHASSGSDPITPDAIGAAATQHEHSAEDITSGILDIARGGTGASDAATALEKLGVPAAVAEAVQNSGAAKIATGSYTGTGTYGADNPCSLTFDFLQQNKGVF